MIALTMALLLPILLWGQLRLRTRPTQARLLVLLVGAYVFRIAFHLVASDYPFFSYGAGGDAIMYDELARLILHMWDIKGPFYATGDDLPLLGRTTLPSNLFALIGFLNAGEPARFACTAFVAYVACQTVLLLHDTAMDFHGDPDDVFKVCAIVSFSPAFVLYSSDTYKDGIVAFLVVWSMSCILRFTRKLDPWLIAQSFVAMLGLYLTRFYLVFLIAMPLVASLLAGKSRTRNAVMVVALVAFVPIVMEFTDLFHSAGEAANAAYDVARNPNGHAENARFGSGVELAGDDSLLGLSIVRVVYTLFSPFPWQTGSLALHLGKIDTFLWYYLLWRGTRSARELWSRDQALLLCFGLVLVLGLLMYSVIMSNVGLILRERFPLLLIAALLGMCRAPEDVAAQADEPDDSAVDLAT